jgi:hypothetical protein
MCPSISLRSRSVSSVFHLANRRADKRGCSMSLCPFTTESDPRVPRSSVPGATSANHSPHARTTSSSISSVSSGTNNLSSQTVSSDISFPSLRSVAAASGSWRRWQQRMGVRPGRATTARELEAGGQASEEDIKIMGRRFSGRRGGRTKIFSVFRPWIRSC